MNIGFIGAGRTGCTLGKYLNVTCGTYVTVAGYYSKTGRSADEAATFTQSKAFYNLENLVDASDVLFITTPDRVIEEVWEYIKHYNLKDKIICHFSGSLSSGIFSGIEATGASCCSIHPMYAFSSKYKSYLQFNKACLSIEGEKLAVKKMTELFADRLHHKVFKLVPADKVKYHAAAAFASNYITGAMHIAIELLKECGFTESDARELLFTVSLNNISSVLETGTLNALTGPVERNDVSTVRKHLGVLKDREVCEVYKSLGKVLVRIAEQKNPDRDYSEIKSLFKMEDSHEKYSQDIPDGKGKWQENHNAYSI